MPAKNPRQEDISSIERLEAELVRQHGHMLTGDALRCALGYPSMDALRQAHSRGTLPVLVFTIKNRRGKWALTHDVACWIIEQRNNASSVSDAEEV
jgi:hypothetical protein